MVKWSSYFTSGKEILWQNGFPVCLSEQAAHLHVVANSRVTVGLKCTEG